MPPMPISGHGRTAYLWNSGRGGSRTPDLTDVNRAPSYAALRPKRMDATLSVNPAPQPVREPCATPGEMAAARLRKRIYTGCENVSIGVHYARLFCIGVRSPWRRNAITAHRSSQRPHEVRSLRCHAAPFPSHSAPTLHPRLALGCPHRPAKSACWPAARTPVIAG